MKKETKILISVAVLILVLIVIIVNLLKLKEDISNNIPDEAPYVEIELDTHLEVVSARNNFYIVKNCINKFYTYCTYKDNEEVILSMLDEEYISYNGITKSNITTYLPTMKKIKVNIDDMYVSRKTENIYIYFVYGDLVNTSNAQVEEFSMIVKVDMENRTFKVLLKDYLEEKYPNIQGGEYIQIRYPETIESNDYNIFDYKSISDQTYIGDVFDNFIDNMLYNRESAYESLNEKYRSKRFPTYESFKNFIKDNIRNITVTKLSQYQKNTSEDGSVQYICVDSNDNYYIINELSTMNCEFILDTYTVDLPEFITKYEEADETTRVGLNIEKIKEAINFKDFEYVYNKTDNTFKTNKFKNFEEFKNYLKSNLFEQNIFEYKNIEEKGNVYIATIIVKNKKDTKVANKEFQVLMKLTDSTDYSISFNFSE